MEIMDKMEENVELGCNFFGDYKKDLVKNENSFMVHNVKAFPRRFKIKALYK
jgi:hypothetical protein